MPLGSSGAIGPLGPPCAPGPPLGPCRFTGLLGLSGAHVVSNRRMVSYWPHGASSVKETQGLASLWSPVATQATDSARTRSYPAAPPQRSPKNHTCQKSYLVPLSIFSGVVPAPLYRFLFGVQLYCGNHTCQKSYLRKSYLQKIVRGPAADRELILETRLKKIIVAKNHSSKNHSSKKS